MQVKYNYTIVLVIKPVSNFINDWLLIMDYCLEMTCNHTGHLSAKPGSHNTSAVYPTQCHHGLVSQSTFPLTFLVCSSRGLHPRSCFWSGHE